MTMNQQYGAMPTTQQMGVWSAISLRGGTATAIAVARAAVAIVGVAQPTSAVKISLCLSSTRIMFYRYIVIRSAGEALAKHLLDPLYPFMIHLCFASLVLSLLRYGPWVPSWMILQLGWEIVEKMRLENSHSSTTKAKSAAIAADDDGEVEAPPDESESCKAWNFWSSGFGATAWWSWGMFSIVAFVRDYIVCINE